MRMRMSDDGGDGDCDCDDGEDDCYYCSYYHFYYDWSHHYYCHHADEDDVAPSLQTPWLVLPGLLDVFKPLVNQAATDWASCESEQANELRPWWHEDYIKQRQMTWSLYNRPIFTPLEIGRRAKVKLQEWSNSNLHGWDTWWHSVLS